MSTEVMIQIAAGIAVIAMIVTAAWWLNKPENRAEIVELRKAMQPKSKVPPAHAPAPAYVPTAPGAMPAGWYPNPIDPTLEAYWGGTSWTQFVRPVQSPTTGAGDSVMMLVAWLTAIVSLGYMLPWAVAATRQMPNHGAIALVNLLLGWTGIGWVIALVMACMQRKV